ncbi:MAG: GTP-binding protein, partial [bacterium]|nr:GTP-binding protein [bacterium]
LKRLHLNNNPIEDYAPLEELKNLTRLTLGHNDLTDASFLAPLTKLQYLDLSNNKLGNVSFLADLKNVTHLNLKGNHISDISCLNELEHLTHLDLRNNKINRLPHKLLNRGLKITWKDIESDGILLNNNPLEPPPVELEKQGNHAVIVYLKSLFGDEQPISEVKVLLLGHGAAGKTTLVKRICGEDIDRREPMTPGVNIKSWETISRDEHVKVNFWDFGGQEILQTTHQFFLTKRSLYILVLDGRKDEQPEYWLDHVRVFGDDSPVFVVLNKIDEHPNFDVDRKTLKKKYPNIKGFFRMSCLKKNGVPEFTRALTSALIDVEMVKTVWPVNWIAVKSQLEYLNDNYITSRQYREICHKHNIKENESQDTLLSLLHDIGIMLHFKDPNLMDTKVLRPEWVTKGVYKIVTSELVKSHQGILMQKWLSGLLTGEPNSRYFYPKEIHPFFIDLMKKFKLCYPVNGDTLLLPDKLEVAEPEFDFDYDASINFYFKYNFFHPSILTKFMVTMHQDIKPGLRWRNGVVLYNKSFRSCAVVRAVTDEKRIAIYVDGQSKRDYLSVIRFYLKNINRGYEKIQVEERICLKQEPGISVEYDYLLELLKIGEIYTRPDGSLKQYLIQEILEGFAQPESRAEKRWILGDAVKRIRAEETYQPKIKKKIKVFL